VVVSATLEQHPALGPVWRTDAPDGRRGLYVPRWSDGGGRERVAPPVTAEALAQPLERSWRAHRAVDGAAARLRTWEQLTGDAGEGEAPLALTLAEARLLAAILRGRLPTLAEVKAILSQCGPPALASAPDSEVTVWTSDRETLLDAEFDKAGERFADQVRPREVLESHDWLRTGRRRTWTFAQAGRSGAGAAEETARCALWLVADSPSRSDREGAAV
jgi:hypothetical protein